MFLPSVLYIVLLVGVPFVLAVLYAFSDARIGSVGFHFVGLENFRSILQSPSFRKALRNSVVFTLCAQAIVIVCSNILSIALEKPFRGRGFVRFLILLPWVAPVSLGTIGWKWILDSIYSVITWVLVALHLYKPYGAPMWLGEPHLAMASVILVHCWRLIPFSTVIMLAGRSAIPKEIPEAAAIDGAGFWRTLFQINIPMMTPILSVAVLFGIIFTFTDMTVVYILTAGGPFDSTQTLPSLAFATGIAGQRPRRGRGDLALPRPRARRRRLSHAPRREPHGDRVTPRGGLPRVLAKALKAFVLVFFTVLLAFPFFWMLIASFKQNIDLYTVENNPFLFNLPPTLEHLRLLFFETRFVRWLGNTALVGVLVVAITLLLAVPAAYALTRLTGRWGERLGIAIFLTYLIPPTLLFIPLSRVVAILGLQDSIFSVVLVYPSMTIPFSDLAADGFFQVDSEGAGRRGHGGRPDAIRRLPSDGRAHLRFRNPDGRHFQLHAGDPGVRLRPDLHFAGIQPDGGRGNPDLPGARRRLLLGIPDGGVPRRVLAYRPRLQPLPGSLHSRVYRRLRQMSGARRSMGVRISSPAGAGVRLWWNSVFP